MTILKGAGRPSQKAKPIDMADTPIKPVRFTLDLARDLHKRLKLCSVEERRHAAEIVRDALEAYLAGKEG